MKFSSIRHIDVALFRIHVDGFFCYRVPKVSNATKNKIQSNPHLNFYIFYTTNTFDTMRVGNTST